MAGDLHEVVASTKAAAGILSCASPIFRPPLQITTQTRAERRRRGVCYFVHESAAASAVTYGTLAKGHARTTDAAVLAGYVGRSTKLDTSIATFAMAYADQTKGTTGCSSGRTGRGEAHSEVTRFFRPLLETQTRVFPVPPVER